MPMIATSSSAAGRAPRPACHAPPGCGTGWSGGVEAAPHRSRRLSRALVRAADLVLVTERRQITEVEAIDPFARGKVHLLGKWEDAEIADPHGGPEADYRESYTLIERLVQGWLQKIC
nr:hypothetical protein [Burkholderia pseudomallei]